MTPTDLQAQSELRTTSPETPTLGSGLAPLPYFLGLMFLVSTLNMADRQIIGIVAEPIKREFGLSDTLLGLLSGTAFALVYPPLGLPIARLADRFNRRNILAICLAFWSAMTMLCGMASNFWALAAARAGVAAGEAGYAPCTHSLIADHAPPHRRALAFSILVMGISAGALLASVVGGAVAQVWGWRAAFAVVGAPGMVLAALVVLTLKEPPRAAAPVARPNAMATYRRLLAAPAFTFCVLGSAFHLMVTYGGAAWTVAYFVRAHGLGLAQAGLVLGLAGAAAGALGSLVGGMIGDRLGGRDRRWLAWWPCVTVLAAVAVGAPAYLTQSLPLAVAGVTLAVFLNALYQPSTYALVQSVADPAERASAAALMIFIQNLIGLGLGPLAVGMISDALTPAMGPRALGAALALSFALNLASAAAFWLSGRAWGRGPALQPSGVSQ